jgi:hypothetical protein
VREAGLLAMLSYFDLSEPGIKGLSTKHQGLLTSRLFCKNVFTSIPFKMLKSNNNDNSGGVTRML